MSGNWGWQDPRPGWQPLLQGSTWGDARTSVEDALLHLGAQLREEHVLGRLLCRVIEENLKERKISKNSSSSVTLWRHTGLVTSKGSPEHPAVTSSKGIYDLIKAARGPMGWKELLLLCLLKPRSMAGLTRRPVDLASRATGSVPCHWVSLRTHR